MHCWIGCNKRRPDESANLLAFLKVLRAEIGRDKLITAAVPASGFRGPDGKALRSFAAFANEMDYVNLMTVSANKPRGIPCLFSSLPSMPFPLRLSLVCCSLTPGPAYSTTCRDRGRRQRDRIPRCASVAATLAPGRRSSFGPRAVSRRARSFCASTPLASRAHFAFLQHRLTSVPVLYSNEAASPLTPSVSPRGRANSRPSRSTMGNGKAGRTKHGLAWFRKGRRATRTRGR